MHADKSVKLMKPGGIPYTLPPKRPLSANKTRTSARQPINATNRRVIDSILPAAKISKSSDMIKTAAKSRPVPLQNPLPFPEFPLAKKDFTAPTTSRHKILGKFRWLEVPFIVVTASAIGLLIQSLVVGELIIGAYTLVALFFKVKSAVSFMLALMSLCIMIFVLIFNSMPERAENFATYTFLLLIIGVISLVLEQRQQAKWARPNA